MPNDPPDPEDLSIPSSVQADSLDMSGAGVDPDALAGDVTDALLRAEQRRIERAIRGAIRAGYDGVDINRPPHTNLEDFGVVSIVPWDRPAPDGDNGFRTERYTWDWFSDDELTRVLRADHPHALLPGGED